MQTGVQDYGSGTASLFASLARTEPQGKPVTCECCGAVSSGEQAIDVHGYRIPRSHTACKGQIERQMCCCYERIGDNPACVVHGGG